MSQESGGWYTATPIGQGKRTSVEKRISYKTRSVDVGTGAVTEERSKTGYDLESFYEIYVEDMIKIESVIIPGEQKQISPEQKFFPISESER